MGPVSWHMPRCFAYGRNVIGMGKFVVDKRSACGARKRGFTLMELMVYIAIVGIVVIVAGQAFSNSTKMRVRTQSMLKASEVAENVAALFKQDVAQTGAKSSMEAGVADGGASYGNKFGTISDSIYMHPKDDTNPDLIDSSSYQITTDDNGQSNLIMRRVRYSEQGYYQAIEEVNWFVDHDKIMRSCRTVEGTASDDCAKVTAAVAHENAVEMAEDVETFTVEAAAPRVSVEDVQEFPPDDGSEFRLVPRTGLGQYVMFTSANTSGELNKGGAAVVLSQFFSNYSLSGEAILGESERKVNQAFAIKNETEADTWNNLCTKYGSLTLDKNFEYEISFQMEWEEDNSRLFVPGEDHMSVGFRDIGTGDIPRDDAGKKLLDDFHFFPPVTANGNGTRTMRFMPPKDISNVCMAFTFACYSPLVSQGKVTIKNLRLRKVPGASYEFNGSDIDANDRQNVKAMRLTLSVKKNGEEGAVSVVVWTPSNGPSD